MARRVASLISPGAATRRRIVSFPVASARSVAVSPSHSAVTSAPRLTSSVTEFAASARIAFLERRRSGGIQAVRIYSRSDDLGDEVVAVAGGENCQCVGPCQVRIPGQRARLNMSVRPAPA